MADFNSDFNDWKNGRGTKISVINKWESSPAYETVYKSGAPDEDLEHLIQGFVSCLMGHTWSHNSIIEALKQYVEEHEDTEDQNIEI